MEANILLWVQENLRYEWLDPIVKAITNTGYFIWVILALWFLINKNSRKLGIVTSVSLVYNLLLVNLVLKNIIGRTRPYEVIEGLVSIVGEQSDKSFPSGHTSIAFAFVAVLWFMSSKKISVPLTILAALISFSRVYIGVHYPTDILGGVVFGILCAIFAIWTIKFVENKISNKSNKKEAF